MIQENPEFHFPPDIHLKNRPLMEAWLELRWELEFNEVTQQKTDPGFPFALGVFFEGVRKRYRHREDLDASRIPEGLFPYFVRYRFRPGEGEWPLLQLGPGVATVNFTESYTWPKFEKEVIYLQEQLLGAYGDPAPRLELAVLRYRNGVPFDRSAEDLLSVIQEKLNTAIKLPRYIPGPVGTQNQPAGINLFFSYDLSSPLGTGILRLNTGTIKRTEPSTGQVIENDMLFWQLEVKSQGDQSPQLDREGFSDWLFSAHAVIHEWFFSLIEGDLFNGYKGDE